MQLRFVLSWSIWAAQLPHYSSPACFSCSIVTSEGGEFFSAVLSSSLWFVRCDCRGSGAGRRQVGSAQWLLPGVLFLFFNSVAQSCPTLCDPMNHSTPGLPVHHQLPEFTQTHVHRVGDAIQPSHPLLSPSPPAPNPSQHQSFPMSQLQSIGVSALASVLPMNTQD